MHVDDSNPPCPALRQGPVSVSLAITTTDLSTPLSGEGLLPCGSATRKLISRSTFVLEGGGWASDGYSSNGGSKK